jgi:hypothetical protein
MMARRERRAIVLNAVPRCTSSLSGCALAASALYSSLGSRTFQRCPLAVCCLLLWMVQVLGMLEE